MIVSKFKITRCNKMHRWEAEEGAYEYYRKRRHWDLLNDRLSRRGIRMEGHYRQKHKGGVVKIISKRDSEITHPIETTE